MTFMTPAPVDQEKVNEEMWELKDAANQLRQTGVAAKKVQASKDSASTAFTWKIEKFSKIKEDTYRSRSFLAIDFKWRLLIFPKGKYKTGFSVFLEAVDSSKLHYGWSKFAFFSLKLVCQIDPEFSIKGDSVHQFNAKEIEWGFPSFLPLDELHDPTRGFLVDDMLVIEAVVSERMVDHRQMYDSKKETGYVGLKNQGATCYMNSLLQTLYHIPYFRKAVYHMPASASGGPAASIPLALQNLFYKLQHSNISVETQELTKSFGWDNNESSMQHDVQELNRVLCEKLEGKMKGTVVEGTIQRLFEGHVANYIQCINVDYESIRHEFFYDLQLDVKGCRDVYASFDKYVEVERLEGQNKYQAAEHGLQDARKGCLFVAFPSVLQLHLKRFEYESTSGTQVKINDRYEFPLQLDLDRENGKYLSPDANTRIRNLYALHSVLVHSGGTGGGHYYAFIRPTLSDQWYKFNDEQVTKADSNKALEEQYGGDKDTPNPEFDSTPYSYARNSNAYMLVYIRECDKDELVCNVDENDFGMHLRERLKKEQEEKENKAKIQLFTMIKVVRDEDLIQQIGKNIYFDLVDRNKIAMYRRVQKDMPFLRFKENIVNEIGAAEHLQRFWFWTMRSNGTYRPSRPLTVVEENYTIQELKDVSRDHTSLELTLFLEVEMGPDLVPIDLQYKAEEDLLLFFKLYDPETEELRYVGRLLVKETSTALDIFPKLNKMAGYASDEDIELYEEIGFHPTILCEPIDMESSFEDNLFTDGDIICYQRILPDEWEGQLSHPNLPSFMEYIQNRQVVRFRSLKTPSKDDFSLELSRLHTYDDVIQRMAQHIGLDDPSEISLTSHNRFTHRPQRQSIKFRGVASLSEMLTHRDKISDILYYEVLTVPLPELEDFKTLTLLFFKAGIRVSIRRITLLRESSTIFDAIEQLKMEVKLSHPAAKIRLFEVLHHKICKVYSLDDPIEDINENRALWAEEIPEEEKKLGPHDRLVPVFHFERELILDQFTPQNFGDPFFFPIFEYETLAEIKVRMQIKLQESDEEFAKWKFAIVTALAVVDYLEDSEIVSVHFQKLGVYGPSDRYLGLEHPKPPFTGIDLAGLPGPIIKLASPSSRSRGNSSIKIYN